MYVYIRSEPQLWTVGFYRPDGKFESESDHSSSEKAASRVAWLNGPRKELEAFSSEVKRAMRAEEENDKLRENLKIANSNHEEFERKWYLESDENEKLREEIATLRQQLLERKALWAQLSIANAHTAIAAKDQEIAELRKDADKIYDERNRIVAALAKFAVAAGFAVFVTRTAIEGWNEDWLGCIYIEGPTGQLSWHFHDSQASLFSDFRNVNEHAWDGHSTEQKYLRMRDISIADLIF